MGEPEAVPQPDPTPFDPAAVVSEAWVGKLRADRNTGGARAARTYVYASGIKSCVRSMALDLTNPEDQAPFTDDALARMKKGEEREASIVAWLHQIGPRSSPPFKVIEGQRRFEIKDRDGQILIVGKVDCRLDFGGGRKPFVEVKSGESVRNVDSFEAFDRSPWTRHMPDQLLSYLFAENEPVGIFVLDRPGLPAFVTVRLDDHLERVERVLGNVRRAVDVKAIDAPLPPFITDAAECRRCHHFKKSCTPPIDYGPGVTMVTDPVLIEAAATRDRTRAAADEYEAADKRLKEALRGVEAAIVGDYMATGKWAPTTTYNVPKEIKAQYAEKVEKGRFTLRIEKIDS